ncbi:MAG: ferrochelatase [Oceanococcaceae bacterium]
MSPSPATGILLVNLGTPDAPTAKAVRRYLGEFLADTRVVEIPPPVWLLLLYLVILPRRSPRVARNYAKIWTDRGSPLRFHTEDQAQALGELTGLPCIAAFRYGQPSLQSGLDRFREQGIERIVVLPMYPQNSATTTATIFDKIARLLRKRRDIPDLQFVASYPTHPLYITALARQVRAHWDEHGRAQKLVLSFHGLPQRNVKRGDPYQRQCEQTAQALITELGLADADWVLTYQSRFGPQQWLQPYTEPTLEELAQQGIRSVDVICPGFLADCLETLEEIAIGARETFEEAGGETLRYIPALNADPQLTQLFADLVTTPLAGSARAG